MIPTEAPIKVGFLLIPGFALMSYASAIEPLRAANVLSGKTLYQWSHVSLDGNPAPASSGVTISCDEKIGDVMPLKRLIVCAGGNPAAFHHAATFRWLRLMARRGVEIGGVSGGPYILARAGLLDGYRFTIHWEHMPALTEDFPGLTPEPTLYVIDRDRLTCAGGVAAIDMMHALIETDFGPRLSAAVSEWFLHTQVRLGSGPQRMGLRERFNVTNRTLLRALNLMEANIEEPLSRGRLAGEAGVSPRQLDRLFTAHLGMTARAYYLQIRLERARTLLRQTAMPVLDVGIACGFASASDFSRAYARLFGYAPREERPGFAVKVGRHAAKSS